MSPHHKVLWRNARFQAYRDLGVPVFASWALSDKPGNDSVGLLLGCDSCDIRQGRVWAGADFMEDVERDEVARTVRWWGCSHLGRLLVKEDPPEVLALVDLALVAMEW